MVTRATTATLDTGRGHRPGLVVAQATLAATLALGLFHAPASTNDDCIARQMAKGQSEDLAKITCLRISPTTPTPSLPRATAADEGTSTGVVVAVGLGGLVLGAAAMAALRRRPAGAAGDPAAAASPAGGFPAGAPSGLMGMPAPGMPAPGMPAPGAGVAGVADRSPVLVTALVDLSDRVSSQALRAEILAALDRAGVHALEPATGEVFDATRMRGVGGAPAPDPTWVGRVATTERVGFLDGGTVVRLPEVVVYTNGG